VAKKTICSIPAGASLVDFPPESCINGSHRHLSCAQARDLQEQGSLVWLAGSLIATNKTRCVVTVTWQREVNPALRHPGTMIRGSVVNTGLSYRVGEYMANAVRRKEPWARAMLSQITMRPQMESA
jgi:hypothetical protein